MYFKRYFVNKPFLRPFPSMAIVPGAQANAINEPALCMALRPTDFELVALGSRASTSGLRKWYPLQQSSRNTMTYGSRSLKPSRISCALIAVLFKFAPFQVGMSLGIK